MTPPDGLPTPARHRATATIVLGIALSVLDGTIVNLALPGIARDLHASAAQVVRVVNAYQVAILALLLPLALLGDLVGYRRIYLAGLALFTVASLGCVLATSLPALAAARAVQGMGAAGVMAVNAALVRLTYPRHLLGRGVAINSVVVAAASVAGPSIAATILSVASWPWLFAVNLPLGALVLWLGLHSLPANTSPPLAGARLRPGDAILNAAMFVLLFLGADGLVARAGDAAAGPAGAAPLWMLLAGVCVAVVYLRRQRARAVPLFPVDLLRIPVFRLSMCTSVGAFAAQMLASIALPFLLLEGYGYGPAKAGAVLTAWPLATIALAPVAGRLIGRYPDGLLGGIGLAAMGLGLALLALLPTEPSAADLMWRMALCGAGFGLFQSPNNHTIVTSAPAHRAGGASGMLGTARLTGQSLAAVMAALMFTLGPAHGNAPLLAVGTAAAASFAGALFSLLRLRHGGKA
jgi:DHA2 family multidrug resistance protein-like MFS transporter